MPGVDIIIYNATASKTDESIGYVCVEVENEPDDSHLYKRINTEALREIRANLRDAYDIVNRSHHNRHFTKQIKISSSFSKVISMLYSLLVAFLGVVAFKKIESWEVAIFTIGISLITLLTTYLIISIVVSLLKKQLTNYAIVRKRLEEYECVFKNIDQSNIENLILNKRNEFMNKMHLCSFDDISITSECVKIWLLTDLSHEASSQPLEDWLESVAMNNIPINIILPMSSMTNGRKSAIENLVKKHEKLLKVNQCLAEKEHYIWSSTYGVIYIEKQHGNRNNLLYLSLGDESQPLLKEIKTNENDLTVVLSILKGLKGKT